MSNEQHQALTKLQDLALELKKLVGDIPRDLQLTLEDIKEYILRNK